MSLTQIRRKTGTHSAIKIRRFFCYFIFVIYFCTTRNRESCCFSSAVEHFLGKEEVPGSSPGNSSKKRGCLTNRRHPLYLFLFVLLSRNHFRICDSRKIKNLPAPLQPHAQCRRHSLFERLCRVAGTKKLCFRTTFRPVSTLRQSPLDFALPHAARPSLRWTGGDLANS